MRGGAGLAPTSFVTESSPSFATNTLPDESMAKALGPDSVTPKVETVPSGAILLTLSEYTLAEYKLPAESNARS